MSRRAVRYMFTAILSGSFCVLPYSSQAKQPDAPELSSVEPFVIHIGETNQLTLKGKNLHNLKSIWTSRNGVIESDQLLPETNDKGTEVSVRLDIDATTVSGPFAIRAINTNGISSPKMCFIELLDELSPSNDETISRAGYVSGSIGNPDGIVFKVRIGSDETNSFAGHTSEVVAGSFEVFAGRFGSKLDPVITLELEGSDKAMYAHDSPGLGVDCYFDLVKPIPGNYIFRIRDARYGSGTAYRYHARIGSSVGSSSYLNVVSKEQYQRVLSKIELVNNRHESLDDHLSQKPLGVMVYLQASGGSHYQSYTLVPISSYPTRQLNSDSSQETPELFSSNVSINSSFTKPDQLLVSRIRVDKSGRYRWVAISRRLGGQSDPAIRLKTIDGKLLKESHMFDNESTLSYEFMEPGTYVLELWDLAGQFGPHANFHIQAQTDPAEFELNTETDSVRIEPGKETNITINIDRDGYGGPVAFKITTPIDGVSLSDVVAKKGSKERTIKIVLNESIAPGETFPIKISGYRGEKADAPRSPLYTQAYWKKRFPDLYSPMFEFEDTIWVTVLQSNEPEDKTENSDEAR